MWISLSFHLGHWFDSFSTVGLRNSLRVNKRVEGGKETSLFIFRRREELRRELSKQRSNCWRRVRFQESLCTDFEELWGHEFRGTAREYGCIYCSTEIEVRPHLLWLRFRCTAARFSRKGTAAFKAVRLHLFPAQKSRYGLSVRPVRFSTSFEGLYGVI